MMENFETYVRENKSAFDKHRPNRDKLWSNIEAKLEKPDAPPKAIKLWESKIFKIAAVLVVALGVFSLFTIVSSSTATKDQFVSQELLDIDTHYQGLVAYQVALVKKNSKLTDAQKNEFLSFMDDLDSEYDLLKQELGENIDNERVLEAIVINYKKRIELIERLLKQLNNTNKTNDTDVYTL
ncbi:hypothetical protein [Cognatitamlana onchidii]|uniref:hypothetical protein n=1 Tax=Cognatitamlana onchidii TaxID=2562860 RepID=UPI0010A5B0CD|nr:hypothetical protein [Algibacter onchidii]